MKKQDLVKVFYGRFGCKKEDVFVREKFLHFKKSAFRLSETRFFFAI
jgi:hypothetical protein